MAIPLSPTSTHRTTTKAEASYRCQISIAALEAEECNGGVPISNSSTSYSTDLSLFTILQGWDGWRVLLLGINDRASNALFTDCTFPSSLHWVDTVWVAEQRGASLRGMLLHNISKEILFLLYHTMCVLSCSVMSNCATPWAVAHQALCPGDFPIKNTRVGSHFLFQGIVLTQRSNSCLLHLLPWQADSLPLHHFITPSMTLSDI